MTPEKRAHNGQQPVRTRVTSIMQGISERVHQSVDDKAQRWERRMPPSSRRLRDRLKQQGRSPEQIVEILPEEPDRFGLTGLPTSEQLAAELKKRADQWKQYRGYPPGSGALFSRAEVIPMARSMENPQKHRVFIDCVFPLPDGREISVCKELVPSVHTSAGSYAERRVDTGHVAPQAKAKSGGFSLYPMGKDGRVMVVDDKGRHFIGFPRVTERPDNDKPEKDQVRLYVRTASSEDISWLEQQRERRIRGPRWLNPLTREEVHDIARKNTKRGKGIDDPRASIDPEVWKGESKPNSRTQQQATEEPISLTHEDVVNFQNLYAEFRQDADAHPPSAEDGTQISEPEQVNPADSDQPKEQELRGLPATADTDGPARTAEIDSDARDHDGSAPDEEKDVPGIGGGFILNMPIFPETHTDTTHKKGPSPGL